MSLAKLSIALIVAGLVPAFAQINDLVKTPPMGWNSWNVFHGDINENQIKEIVDVMVTSGMRDAGYIYLNLDDNWMAKTRDANGDLRADPDRFPSGMKALGDYIHEKGMKFGVYGDRGLRTCHHYNNSNQFPNSQSGSYMKEERDAKMFASWGVDYLKYDNCEPASGSNQREDYERMRDALLNSGRDIVFSICAWGFADWMPQTGNLWRTTGDIHNSWERDDGFFNGVYNIIEKNEKYSIHAGPGKWNDPDMLQVGNGQLTDDEARSQMTMWSIMAAPLLTGNDLRKMTDATKEIYMNADMISVNQDSAGIPGYRLSSQDGKQVWMRPLGGEGSGKVAVVLYNTGASAQTIDFKFTDVGVTSEASVRDVWAKKDLGILQDGYSAQVPSHGVVFLILTTKLDPAEPFGAQAMEIPGKIEVEDYDKGSPGLAYSDTDPENKGDATSYREGGVDVVALDEGYAIGYTMAGEWLAYTVKVSEGAEKVWTARVASGSTTSSFQLFLDDEAITDTIEVPQTDTTTWDVYTEIAGDLKSLPAGEHVLKLRVTGSYVNIDWLKLGESSETPLFHPVQSLNPANPDSYIYDLRGNRVARSLSEVERPGVYIVRSTDGRVNKLVGVKK
jgi:alpha-galactosidase